MRRTLSCMLWFLTLSGSILAQTKDVGLWTGIGAEKEFGKWELASEFEFRTKDRVRRVDRLDLEFEVSRKIIKPLKAGIGYKYIYFYDDKYDNFQSRNRFFIFVQGKQEWGNFKFYLREYVDLTKKDESKRIKESGKTDTYKINPDVTWRNRLKIAYDIPKSPLEPSMSVESFFQLNNPEGNRVEQWRVKCAFEYKVTGHHQVEVYGLTDKEMNEDHDVWLFVAGLGYKYVF